MQQTVKRKFQKNALIDITVEQILKGLAILSGSFIFIIAGVIIAKGLTPFITDNGGLGSVPVLPFLIGDTWLTGPTFVSNLYSIGFIIVSTIYVVSLSLLISFPIGVLTALFIAKIAPKRLAETLRTVIEILASIPSIIYGLFGAGFILKIVYDFSAILGYQSKGGNSVLSTVIILALMTIPTITTISEVSIRSVDKTLIHGSLALGASPTQTNFKVVLAAAKSGIFTSAILGVGRALGEATAVSLVAGGRRSGLSFDILDTTSTLTTTMLEGMKESAGLDYNIRFSVGLVLMVVIVLTNLTLNAIKRKVGNVNVK
ncbi:MAG: phosphate ABC transporter permease subunit PstC [Firmicutes bacterium]|nr:phosphate ABC transporter permease subunit PstC [Bacillota bacterium]